MNIKRKLQYWFPGAKLTDLQDSTTHLHLYVTAFLPFYILYFLLLIHVAGI